MNINSERLKKRFNEMAKIGATESGGVHRLTLSMEDKQARDLFVTWLEELQLKVTIDDFGNIYGRKEGKSPHLPPVVTGSHLDSVAYGGKYDGTLGVLTALEAIETIIDNGIEHEHPIEIVNFTNEEGARYTTPMLGSGALAGIFDQDYTHQLKDSSGKTVIDELKNINYFGDKKNRLKDLKLFIEVHIEQGPILAQNKVDVGIVEGIQGLFWYKVRFTGESDHAGTTPMEFRKDPLVAAAKTMDQLCEWVVAENDGTAITFGKLDVTPNNVNVIPKTIDFTIDIRHPDEATLLKHVETMKDKVHHIAQQQNIIAQIEELSLMKPVHFSAELIEELETLANNSNYKAMKMFSGAGHDAMYMHYMADTAMIFVPSLNGKSHCEEEISDWNDIEKGTDLLYQFLVNSI